MKMQIRVGLICLLAAHIAAAATITYGVNVNISGASGDDDAQFQLSSPAPPPTISFHFYNFFIRPSNTQLPIDDILANNGNDFVPETILAGQQLDFMLTIDSPALFTPAAPQASLSITFGNGSGLPLFPQDLVFSITPTGSVAVSAPSGITVTELPEPSTAFLAATGILTMLAAVKHRQTRSSRD